ncbi:MAG: DNA methyltransferase [Candidatus Aenigmatarchaeota archaeon]
MQKTNSIVGIDLGERGIYDKRNRVNDLTGKEWLQLLKSVWVSEKCAEDKDAFQHPAPFLIKDIQKLVKLFTKKGMVVLDPFMGSGTTLMASSLEGRKSIGIDLVKKYTKLSERRLKKIRTNGYKIIHGDSLKEIPKLKTKIDYCVTSPPYHNILRNKGMGIRADGSQRRQGVKYYSEDPEDVGNQKDYESFVKLFGKIMKEVYVKLNKNKYCSIIISDFTVNKKETNAHGDIIFLMQKIGFEFNGTIVLSQNSKPLYPFGYPYAYKINHHHQYILNFRKV